jgi:hypothetical protein
MAVLMMEKGDYATKMGYPTLLIGGRVEEGLGIGEAFMVLWKPPRAYSLPIKHRIKLARVTECLELVSFGDEHAPSGEEYMCRYASDWAKTEWEHLKYLESEKAGDESLATKNTVFTPQDSWQNELSRMWFADLPKEIFLQISKSTQFNELSRFMEELFCFERPQVEPI